MRRAIPPPLILFLLALSVLGLGLIFEWKKDQDAHFLEQTQINISDLHTEITSAFDSGFFYYYQEKFVPFTQNLIAQRLSTGIASNSEFSNDDSGGSLFQKFSSFVYRTEKSPPPQFYILTSNQKILYSHQSPGPLAPSLQNTDALPEYVDSTSGQKLEHFLRSNQDSADLTASSVIYSGAQLYHLRRWKNYWFLYQIPVPAFAKVAVALLVLLLGIIGTLALFFHSAFGVRFYEKGSRLALQYLKKAIHQLTTLRSQILLSITFVYLVTGLFLFQNFTRFHTQEETQKIDRASIQFSQVTTDKIISDYTNFFFFSFNERFLPAIRNLISSNENLLSITLLKLSNYSIIFDSRNPPEIYTSAGDSETTSQTLSIEPALLSSLQKNGIHSTKTNQLLTIYTMYTGNSPETSFILKYEFQYASLLKTLENLRQRLIINLSLSLLFGFLIAGLLAQLITAPIKRLAKALSQVSLGDYGVYVPTHRLDEIGDMTQAFNLMTNELRKREELRKFVSRSNYQQIVSASSKDQTPSLNGRRVNAAILFCDIRDFVSHCEKLEAEEITHFLNRYFSEMVGVVEKNGGEIDKFIGDALLAVFYSEQSEKHFAALSALQCGLEMKDALKSFNLRREGQGSRAIEIGIGISYGEVISGPIGSADRMDFTVIGDVVNQAARIEKLSKKGKHSRIVFTDDLKKLVEGLILCDPLPVDEIRGKEDQVSVCELIAIRELGQLVKMTRSPHREQMLRGLQVLGFTGHPAAITTLLDFLSHQDEEIRMQTVISLAKLSPTLSGSALDFHLPTSLETNHESDQQSPLAALKRELIDKLTTQLKIDTSEKVQSAIIKSLGVLCNSTELPEFHERLFDLQNFLQHSDQRLVANTIEALGDTGNARALDLIAPLLKSPHHRVKASAALAYFKGGRFEVIQLLKPLLLQSESLMRASSCYAIGELGRASFYQDFRNLKSENATKDLKAFLSELHSCVPLLVSLLKDADLRVVKQSIIALGKIQDRSALLSLMDLVPDYLNQSQTEMKEILEELLYALRLLGAHRFVRDLISRASPSF